MPIPQPISVEDYLEGELISPIKHEYVGGVVYAMAGARNLHNLIATNLLVALGSRLRGKPCRAYNSDTKVRIPARSKTRFYYPDASVVCRPNPRDDSFQDQPVVVAEVLSESTRRIDEGEKQDAYLTLPSLRVYLLIEQDRPLVWVYRRGPSGFTREVYHEAGAVLPLGEIATELPLADLYDEVTFPPEAERG